MVLKTKNKDGLLNLRNSVTTTFAYRLNIFDVIKQIKCQYALICIQTKPFNYYTNRECLAKSNLNVVIFC